MAADIFKWWLAAQLIGLAGLPIAGVLLRALPDQGYAFAKALGLLLTGYVAWLLAMFGLAPFGASSLVVAALAVAGGGLWLAGGPRAALGAARAYGRACWPAILASEAVFLVALLAVVWMRAHDPTPWGTERPMDFAFFNAIQRSGVFPPNDPWLAGYSINYYYFGYLLMAAIAQLTGVAPTVAYNLSLALIFALTAQGVTGMIANLISLASGGRAGRLAYAVFPLLGVIFVLVAANQSGAVQVAVGDERAVALDGRQLLTALGQAASGAETISLPYPAVTQDFGAIEGWQRQDKAAAFNWWWPSRSLWDEYTGEERRYTITEFPLFSFRLGDMHPHVMALPFGLLAAALALATLARPTMVGERRRSWAELILAGLVLGSLYAINSWDLPTYVLLYAGALALLAIKTGAPRPWLAVGRALLVVIASAYLLFIPFHLTFRSLVGGAAPLIDLPILGRITSIIAPYLGGRSGLHAFLIIFGLFFVPIVVFVYLAGGQDEVGHEREPSSALLGLTARPSALTPGVADRIIPALPPLFLLAGLLVGFPLLLLAGLGLLAAERAVRLAQRPGESFGLLLAALGCAVIFGAELIYIRDVFSNRMNTIFKFYYQIWLLWGFLSPFALWWSLRYATGAGRLAAWGGAAVTAALLAGALVYPWLALCELGRGELVGLEAPTPRERTAAGAASISWLRRAAAPGSVVLEAALENADEVGAGLAPPRCHGSYDTGGNGYGGVAAATGLPTVLGWVGHQQQWRGGDPAALDQLGPRCAGVDTIYRTDDVSAAQDLLATYGVDYVYVGGLERSLYPAEALDKFSAIGDAVFQQDEVTIFKLQ